MLQTPRERRSEVFGFTADHLIRAFDWAVFVAMDARLKYNILLLLPIIFIISIDSRKFPDYDSNVDPISDSLFRAELNRIHIELFKSHVVF